MPARPRHVPLRTCVVCGQRIPKRDLARVVASGGGVSLDPDGRGSGRGAYLCRDEDADDTPRVRARLAHALRAEIGDEDWKRLIGSFGRSNTAVRASTETR